MRESAPMWTFQGSPSPSALSISLDGKFAGVGNKSGLTLLNQNGIIYDLKYILKKEESDLRL